jgi:hypothetical protein
MTIGGLPSRSSAIFANEARKSFSRHGAIEAFSALEAATMASNRRLARDHPEAGVWHVALKRKSEPGLRFVRLAWMMRTAASGSGMSNGQLADERSAGL